MYLKYFGFYEDPFGVSPNPRYLYLSSTHHEAFAALLYGVKMRRGFMCLAGMPGTGKTTLLYALLEQLEEKNKTVFLPGTDLTFKQRLQYILESLGGTVEKGDSVLTLTRQLQNLLAELWRAGSNVVLIFDEAQGLSLREMEDIRLLTNFETPQAKLMQVILVGQPQLRQKLASPQLAQLKQRISVNVSLTPLSQHGTAEYIEHRLLVAGWNGFLPKLFERQALTSIYQFTGGIPRLINALCHNSLLIAYALNKSMVDAQMVKEAAQELDLPESTAARFPEMDSTAEREAELRNGPQTIDHRPPTVVRRPSFIVHHEELSLPEPLPEPFASSEVVASLQTPATQPVESLMMDEPLDQIEEIINQSQPPAGQATSKAPLIPPSEAAPLRGEDIRRQILSPRPMAKLWSWRFGWWAAAALLLVGLGTGIFIGQHWSATASPPPPPQPMTERPGPTPAAITPSQRSIDSAPLTPRWRTVTVQKNDDLARILRREYGYANIRLAQKVQAANPSIDDFNYLEIGQELVLPMGSVENASMHRKDR